MQKELAELKSFLDKSGVEYVLEEHEHIHTAAEASKARNVELKHGVKALVVKVEHSGSSDIVLVLVRGDRKMDPKKLCSILKAKRAHLADPAEAKERTGCEVGSVHPFGSLFGLHVYMDESIGKVNFVSFSAGTHTHSVRMQTKDFVNLVRPRIEDLAK